MKSLALVRPETHLPDRDVACKRGGTHVRLFTFTDQHIGAEGSRFGL